MIITDVFAVYVIVPVLIIKSGRILCRFGNIDAVIVFGFHIGAVNPIFDSVFRPVTIDKGRIDKIIKHIGIIKTAAERTRFKRIECGKQFSVGDRLACIAGGGRFIASRKGRAAKCGRQKDAKNFFHVFTSCQGNNVS